MSRFFVWAHSRSLGMRRRLGEEAGFQTAEAIGIAAVGIVVLSAIMLALQALGLDVIGWMRDRFGVGN